MPRRMHLFAVSAAIAALLAAGASGAARQRDLPHVTLFGDSVAQSLYWQPVEDVLSQGVDLDLEAAECRRIEDASCDAANPPPSSVLQTLAGLNQAPGPVVVMVIGYNEFAGDWVKSVGDLLAQLEQDGVKHVFWLTLREVQHQYVSMNDQLGTFTALHPVLTILDWNAYSRSHPDWFQGDGLHLLGDGAFAMASFIHSALADAGIAQPPAEAASAAKTATAAPAPVSIGARALPAAQRDRPYRAVLVAHGGKPPYRWRRVGRLPRGFHLASDGLVSGIPRVGRGAFRLSVNVTDAAGTHAAGRVSVRVV